MRFLLFVFLAIPNVALARPEAPSVLCATYPESAACRGRLAECSTCHVSTWPPAWNSYGLAIASMREPVDFASDLPRVLALLEDQDADGDGASNLDEIAIGTGPGDPTDVWLACLPEIPATGPPVGGGYDFRRAFVRVSVLYCGRSPSYDELAAFDDGAPPDELYLRVHARLDRCLASPYWRDVGLARLADERVRPLEAVGADSPVGITVGDYEWDYRLWSYVLTGDRDVRDLLLADYHVTRNSDGTLVPIEGTIDPPRAGRAGGQPLEANRRAGMITTQWFLSINTMFSPLPRTTAAQAYRSYLGFDIAKQEGLVPIAGEPADVDRRGVTEPSCALCHSTLDPLSYAFAYYNGITGANTGAYAPDRPARVMPDWADNQTMLLGAPVGDVRAWATAAASTDEFRQNLGHMFFRHALEREPLPGELPEFDAAWAALPADGWSANRLLHRLIDTSAFGVSR
jgi:hypothetical protein